MTDAVPTPEQAEEALHLPPLPANAPWWATYVVSNWRQIYKAASTWVIAVIAAVPMLQEILPTLRLDQAWDHRLTALLAVLAIVAKFVNQKPKE